MIHPSVGSNIAVVDTVYYPDSGLYQEWLWEEFPGLDNGPRMLGHDRFLTLTFVRAAIAAMRMLKIVAQQSLEMVDDIALTTRAYEYLRKPMFTSYPKRGRNDLCICVNREDPQESS